jgi:hypothetical protein
MVSTIGFPVFSIELPDLYTREFGAPSTMRVLVTKWEAGVHRGCSGVVLRENPIANEPLCLSDEIPPGHILTLHGTQSALGFAVTASVCRRVGNDGWGMARP